MTKEELFKAVARLELQLQEAQAEGREVRKEFARAFNWKVKTSQYREEYELSIPTWPQVFVKLGELLCKQSTLALSEDMVRAQEEIGHLKYEVEQIKFPLQ